ncbi:MAG: glycosyltransferase family 2 protein [Anaerolineae bacterium]|nr:glycosyltransferase family 2 protein [Anaerolineae bacterium]
MGQDIIVVIPAFNEERFIGSVVLKARKYADQVIVVDDGSSDATGEIATAAGATVVRHPVNQGKGVSLSSGFRRAREWNPRAVIVIDGDGQHLVEEIPGILAPVLAGQADIVVGSRYLEERSSVPRHRVVGHRAFNILTNVASGVRVTDSQSGFRAFSPRAAELATFGSTGFSVESEMQFLAQEHKLRLVEVPITIRYNDQPKRSVIAHGLAVLNGVLQIIGQYRPLLFFGLPGLITLLIGLGWGAAVVEIYRQTENLAVGYALISVMLFMLGSLSLFVGMILHSVRGLLLSLLHPDQER